MQNITLHDCYINRDGRAFATGTQSLVRLLLEQARRDRRAGLNTRGLISGYPGSPLGGLDHELKNAKSLLDAEGILFQPAVNEELATTALWGSQHLHLYDQPNIDGVFGLWYGKGPGLDRSLDAMRHANMGGVSKYGGMVFAVGDDATGKSSTVAYQSEQTLIAAGVPFFYPRSIHDIVPMGLQAFALSRYAGCCVGLKIVVDTADTSAIIDLETPLPKDISTDIDVGPVHIGKHDTALLRESRLFNLRLPAVIKFQKHHNINHDLSLKEHTGKLGIIAVGKAVPEALEALISLGVKNHQEAGIGLMSIGMPWPIDQQSLINFATRYDEILVIEEKRPIVEDQLARAVVNVKNRGNVSGKFCPKGTPLIPETGELNHHLLCNVIHNRATIHGITLKPTSYNLDHQNLPAIVSRTPWYCAGCPHNSSTKLPDGEIAGMGIGCHSISGFLTPETITNFTQMGGEGAFWIGRAPFSSHAHSFQNMGDGTYAHSGYLGVRAAVAANVKITFKILYNGVVAMTGGQVVAGGQTPWAISEQLAAEGVKKIAVVTDHPDAFPAGISWANNVKIYHRKDLLSVQNKIKQVDGVTAIIYVQNCATELRRDRKRGKLPDRSEIVIINEAVCEGCGDCAQKSNCVAVKPVWHPEGEKKQIDHSTCNKDLSCVSGFCPSFVTLKGISRRSHQQISFPDDFTLPDPNLSSGISNIFIGGIGGTGVSTLSGILVMAAHIDNIAGQAVNQTGLSQKNGGVTSQVRLSREHQLDHRMFRLPTRSATLLIGCDGVVAASDMALATLNKTKTVAIMNEALDPVGVAGVGAGSVASKSLVLNRIESVMDPNKIHQIDATGLAEKLFGSTISSNIILLGWALQKGHLPISVKAIEAALRLNAVEVDNNIAALRWGRFLAINTSRVMELTKEEKAENTPLSTASLIDYFSLKLREYQDDAYAKEFMKIITKFIKWLDASQLEADYFGSKIALVLYRAMLIKDEYEVARLLTLSDFRQSLAKIGGTNFSLTYHLSPPLLSWLKDNNGKPRKLKFGGWLTPFLLILQKLRVLRGHWYDPFGYGHYRRKEHHYKTEAIGWLNRLLESNEKTNPKQLDEVLDLMLSIKGYGHVKDALHQATSPKIEARLNAMNCSPNKVPKAAE